MFLQVTANVVLECADRPSAVVVRRISEPHHPLDFQYFISIIALYWLDEGSKSPGCQS